MTKYETLAQQFINDIQNEKLPVGSRLPALRVFAKQHSISMTTATRCYDFLEESGWIFSRPQAGFFVGKLPSPNAGPQMPRLIKGESRDPKRFSPQHGYNQKADFFCPLGTAMVAPSLLPKVALQRCLKRVAAKLTDNLFFYPAAQGEESLRHALANHFQQDHFNFRADEIVITNGCIDSIRLALESVTKEGDTIAISSPCFSGLLDLLVGLKRQIIEIPSNENGLDLVLLESYLRDEKIAAGLFNTSHMNPAGISLTVEQKESLVKLAQKYQVPIIEDDIYFELSHQGKPPLPAKYWDDQGYVIWCGSVSKVLAEGVRIGWCLPGRYLNQLLKQQQLTSLGVSYIMQLAMAEFINTGEYRSHINKLRLTMTRQILSYRQLLMAHLPNDARISMPEGGLVIWIQIPDFNSSLLMAKAAEAKIDIRSGLGFSTHKYYQDCFRINCGWPLETRVEGMNLREKIIKLSELVCGSI